MSIVREALENAAMAELDQPNRSIFAKQVSVVAQVSKLRRKTIRLLEYLPDDMTVLELRTALHDASTETEETG